MPVRSKTPVLPATPVDRFAFLEGGAGQWLENADELFIDGYCPACGAPRGARTDVAVRVAFRDGRERRSHGAHAMRRSDAPVRPPLAPRVNLFSEPFLEGIGPEAREAFTWRPAHVVGAAAHPMFEFAGAQAHASLAELPDARWTPFQCVACGQREVPWYALQEYMPEWLVERGFKALRMRPSAFLAAAARPAQEAAPLPSWFMAGKWYVRDGLVAAEEHWLRRLMRKKFASGVVYQTIERLVLPGASPAPLAVAISQRAARPIVWRP